MFFDVIVIPVGDYLAPVLEQTLVRTSLELMFETHSLCPIFYPVSLRPLPFSLKDGRLPLRVRKLRNTQSANNSPLGAKKRRTAACIAIIERIEAQGNARACRYHARRRSSRESSMKHLSLLFGRTPVRRQARQQR